MCKYQSFNWIKGFTCNAFIWQDRCFRIIFHNSHHILQFPPCAQMVSFCFYMKMMTENINSNYSRRTWWLKMNMVNIKTWSDQHSGRRQPTRTATSFKRTFYFYWRIKGATVISCCCERWQLPNKGLRDILVYTLIPGFSFVNLLCYLC